MAKIAQLVEGNYNILDNIPVINQDLTASGFTPVANTYYRHTGATTDTFTQGVIYLYDTTYHKLGESGGGTTLNRYTYKVPSLDSISKSQIYRISNIISKAKFISRIYVSKYMFSVTMCYREGAIPDANQDTSFTMGFDKISAYNNFSYMDLSISTSSSPACEFKATNFIDNNFVTSTQNELAMEITYYNDTEIT